MSHAAHILIVDDDATIRLMLSRLFTALGYRVSEAADGLTAFRQARLLIPDLILLDLGLPVQDGWTVAREIRAEPALDDTPILCMTAYNSATALHTAYIAGCQHVIQKPFVIETLLATARTLLTSPSIIARAAAPARHSAVSSPRHDREIRTASAINRGDRSRGERVGGWPHDLSDNDILAQLLEPAIGQGSVIESPVDE